MNPNNQHESIIRRIRAAQAIANDTGATEGEKQAALNKVQELLAKYNISLEAAAEKKYQWYKFSYYYWYEEKFLAQIIGYVCLKSNVSYRKRGRTLWFELNNVEYTDALQLWQYYKPLLKQEIEALISAIIQKGGLGIERDSTSPESPIDFDFVSRMLRHMKSLPNIRKELNSKRLLEGGAK